MMNLDSFQRSNKLAREFETYKDYPYRLWRLFMQDVFDREDPDALEETFHSGLSEVGPKDIERASTEAGRKIHGMESKGIPSVLVNLWQDLKTLYGMLSDSITGRYRIPVRTLGAVVFTLLYFVNPLDLLPDFIPVVGYIDDALILKICFDFIAKDLEEYKRWKAEACD